MAKSKKPVKARKPSGAGPSVGLIMMLVFFVIATFVSATVAYMTYGTIAEKEAVAKKAEADKKVLEAKFNKEQVRKIILRLGVGIDSPEDRQIIAGSVTNAELLDQIQSEYRLLREQVYNKVPVPDNAPADFKMDWPWKLMGMNADELRGIASESDPEAIKANRAFAPEISIPSLIDTYRLKAEAALQVQAAQLKRAEDAEQLAKMKDSDKGKAEAEFQAKLAALKADYDTRLTTLQNNFKGLVASQAKNGDAASREITNQGKVREELQTTIDQLTKKLKDLGDKVVKLEAQNAQASVASGGISGNANDTLVQDEKKGEIIRKGTGKFVYINIGSAQRLKPLVTFAVLPANATWRTPEEKERQIKAQLEVVQVLGGDTSLARIVDEKDEIRNPVQPKDLLYNIAFTPNEEIRIAFGGIIDLDGDGLDNNEDFLRLLERQGVIVDEYLQMKPLDFKKRDRVGMTLKTKYLVIASDPRLDQIGIGAGNSPEAEQLKQIAAKMSEMKLRARELNIQLIDAQKFMVSLGLKMPNNPLPPNYGAAYYRDAAPAAPKDPDAPKN